MFAIEIQDHPTLISIYDKKWTLYYTVALKYVENPDTAMEVVQDAFADFIDQYHTKKSMTVDEMEKYLMRIVTNKSKNAGKARSIEVATDEVEEICDDTINVEALLLKGVDNEILLNAMKNVPQQSREYLLLRYINEFNNEEISRLLGIKPQSIPMVQKRAKARVKKIFMKMSGEVHHA